MWAITIRVFIQLNGLSYRYPKVFKSTFIVYMILPILPTLDAKRSEIMKVFVTSKVMNKINDIVSCLLLKTVIIFSLFFILETVLDIKFHFR